MSGAWHEHHEARDELIAAANWYEDRGRGLGAALLDAVDATITSIVQWPTAAPHYALSSRLPSIRSKAILGSYPYRIVYEVWEGSVFVLAYAHVRRRPGYWVDRLGIRP